MAGADRVREHPEATTLVDRLRTISGSQQLRRSRTQGQRRPPPSGHHLSRSPIAPRRPGAPSDPRDAPARRTQRRYGLSHRSARPAACCLVGLGDREGLVNHGFLPFPRIALWGGSRTSGSTRRGCVLSLRRPAVMASPNGGSPSNQCHRSAARARVDDQRFSASLDRPWGI